ncbi:maleylacetoacetate isomerase [Nitrospirillum viridazoti Y2]|uniref:Maleylacetoacetate isomerase n=1 Tax=Nitrospirillum amazonense TaxID=28077 RepID=A0A560HJ60_9PROT|nr:maleylacetoacetate isomerase [Nitrospirillum amazonense]EGX99831.1 maleylacetoacetate isomerase [Nitrospirillum amazonense Y2]TWB46515.1 maleylacetoacetate isomerase [Nitrospirillum amazonense]
MFKMYGFWRSAAAFRVRAALNLKGLAVEETMIDLDAGEQNAPAFLAVNPAAAVPALFVDGGPPLTQSLAILEYLEELYPDPPLLPAGARDRARVRALALSFAADHHPLIVPRVRRHLAAAFGVGHTDWVRHWFREGLAQGEARLAGDPAVGRFCHGDSPTIADLCLVSHVTGAQGFQVLPADYPTIDRIFNACMAIDAFARAAPLRQPGAPR